LNALDDGKLVKKVLTESKKVAQESAKYRSRAWPEQVRRKLKEYGFEDEAKDEEKMKTKWTESQWKAEVKKAVELATTKKWKEEMETKESLRYYRKFKDEPKVEEWMNTYHNHEGRTIRLKLQAGILPLLARQQKQQEEMWRDV
jgi:hypothetical protein